MPVSPSPLAGHFEACHKLSPLVPLQRTGPAAREGGMLRCLRQLRSGTSAPPFALEQRAGGRKDAAGAEDYPPPAAAAQERLPLSSQLQHTAAGLNQTQRGGSCTSSPNCQGGELEMDAAASLHLWLSLCELDQSISQNFCLC